jgi:1-acyl-sn-glycerol-3-phosphate acyltransferase
VDWRKFDPSWARRPLARATREIIVKWILGSLIDLHVHPTTSGLDLFDGIKPPVIFVCNHSSHLDTPCILGALPKDWRTHTATIAAADYFYKNRIVANLVTLSFATVPIERAGGLSKMTSERLNRLFADGWNLLIYPEGTRSRTGELGKIRSGAAYMAIEHRIPIVPIYVQGTFEAMPVGRPWPRLHPVRINFPTKALYPAPGEDHRSLTQRIHDSLTEMRLSTPPLTRTNPS